MLTLLLCIKCKYNWFLLYARFFGSLWNLDIRNLHALLYTVLEIFYILLLKYSKIHKNIKMLTKQ